jgi:co-chaperonin GroES (HSP10)
MTARTKKTSNLPNPMGWKVLVKFPTRKTITAGGIHLVTESQDADAYLNVVAEVMALGPMCYKDRDTGTPWKGGAWAAPGDWVVVPQHIPLKFEIEEEMYAILNDDNIVAQVPNPDSIKVYV